MKLLFLALCVAVAVGSRAVIRAEGEWNWEQHGADWLDDETYACGGSQQSPIDIPDYAPRFTDLPNLRQSNLNYGERTFLHGEDEKVVEVIADEFEPVYVTGGTILLENWQLLQLHFHSKSEHTFNGDHYDLEVHYVHDSGYGQFAVVAYWFTVSHQSHPVIRDIASAIRTRSDTVGSNLRLPTTNGFFFHYRGSLTTPPCTERVDWHIYRQPLPISQFDLDAITGAMYADNYRSTQAMNGRRIGVSGGNHGESGESGYSGHNSHSESGYHVESGSYNPADDLSALQSGYYTESNAYGSYEGGESGYSYHGESGESGYNGHY